MKKIIYIILTTLFALSIGSCNEEEYGENYDINFPASKITGFSPIKEYVDGTITLKGSNLEMVESVSLGSTKCEIISQNDTTLKFIINRSVERAKITIINKYGRKFETEKYFQPRYFASNITTWPTELTMGKIFELQGDNLDLLEKVTVDGNIVYAQGAADQHSIKYMLTSFTPSAQKVVIRVKDKSGKTITSDPIPIANAVIGDTSYKPTSSVLLADWDSVFPSEYIKGTTTEAFESGMNVGGVDKICGNYYSIISAQGNGWDGDYQDIVLNNNGEGIKFSDFHNPYITFLVNTHGKRGYMNPLINGSDKHFTGDPHYEKDDYCIETNGWEWRSYNLTDMGYDLSDIAEGDAITLLIRGGNVGNNKTEPFEINLDQVMITDGYLNPQGVINFENSTDFTFEGNLPITLNDGTGIENFNYSNYLTFKTDAANISGAWDELALLIINKDFNLSEGFENGIYINILLNTANKSGYFQYILKQGENGTWTNFNDDQYGDNYQLQPNQEWEWRSFRLKDIIADATTIDFSKDFNLQIQFKSGNNGINDVEINLDYLFFSSTPIK